MLPLGLLVWAGAEHGGRGPVTMLWVAAIGAGIGAVVGAVVVAVRIYRRARNARWTMDTASRVPPFSRN